MPYACNLYLDCLTGILRFQLFMNSVRYLPFVLAVFLVFWVWKKETFQRFRIQQAFPKAKMYWHEMRYSVLTFLVFSCQATLVGMAGKMGLTQLYLDLDKFGLWYLPVSLLFLTVWHETWFYWAHRWMHRKSVFRRVHAVHHKSTNPSPWAAYSFHWTEAIIEVSYLAIAAFVIPLHPLVIIVHSFHAMILNVLFHTGYEFYPKWFVRGRWSRWINTATHHNMHHSHVHGNYSLYFNFWDRIMGTNFPEYENYYRKVTARRALSGDSARTARGAAGEGAPATS